MVVSVFVVENVLEEKDFVEERDSAVIDLEVVKDTANGVSDVVSVMEEDTDTDAVSGMDCTTLHSSSDHTLMAIIIMTTTMDTDHTDIAVVGEESVQGATVGKQEGGIVV